jgi:hypothetical protein
MTGGAQVGHTLWRRRALSKRSTKMFAGSSGRSEPLERALDDDRALKLRRSGEMVRVSSETASGSGCTSRPCAIATKATPAARRRRMFVKRCQRSSENAEI